MKLRFNFQRVACEGKFLLTIAPLKRFCVCLEVRYGKQEKYVNSVKNC